MNKEIKKFLEWSEESKKRWKEQHLKPQLSNTIKLFGHEYEYVLRVFETEDDKQCKVRLELVTTIVASDLSLSQHKMKYKTEEQYPDVDCKKHHTHTKRCLQ